MIRVGIIASVLIIVAASIYAGFRPSAREHAPPPPPPPHVTPDAG